ncbi:hypothetical protein [Alkalihalobacillus sp. TS-13]|uniref:hypothetical protein n=1 Tax=Alkalihalobacillus sp. TS-13 TaxID=2842455 RepID=UPI001C87FBD6|nr:hypothetical protein [Alkalihalobacillus sp. TS-13]
MNLKNLQRQGKENGITTYAPIPKSQALDLVSYDLRMPDYNPLKNGEESAVTLSEWEDNQIVFSLKYLSSTDEREEIEYITANFDRFYSRIKQDSSYKKIDLKNGKTAFFKGKDFPSAELHWMEGGIEYNLHYRMSTLQFDKVREELVKMANSIE